MSASMAVDLNPTAYLAALKHEAPAELQPLLDHLATLYDKKLYHQLTLALQTFVGHPQSGPFLVGLWESFISPFKDRLNQLRLVEIGVRVAHELEPTRALEFLSALLSSLPVPPSAATPSTKPPPAPTAADKDEQLPTKTEIEAFVLARISVAHYSLLLGDLDETKKGMDVCERVLDSVDGVEPSVTGAWLRVSGDYYKAKAEYGPFYRTTLLYLSCIGLDDLSADERVSRAHDLSLAALLGETIYNFGELLTHPILDSLNGTEFEWIKGILLTFNAGDIGRFEAAVPNFPREPILQENHPFMRQKICLMALIECVFRRPSHERLLPFSTIAAETKLPLDEVEHLIMKALSLKLVRGSLDQVDSTATLNWVQPRVLDKTQIGALAGRLGEWRDKVKGLADDVGGQTPGLFA